MDKYGYCKAKDKDTGKWVEGYFACIPFTTYCFSSDYKANPDNDREYVVGYRMTDWGLPNQPTLTEIEKGSAKRYIGTDKRGRKVFDGDIVHWDISWEDDTLSITEQLYYGDWDDQMRTDDKGNHRSSKVWWERDLWLCDGELVLEEE